MFIRTIRQRISSLVSQPFEFVSPLPLDECVTRLQEQSEPRRPLRSGNPLRVRVSPASDTIYQFRLRRVVGRNHEVDVVGILQQLEDGSTLVSGVGRVSRSTFIGSLVILAILIAIGDPLMRVAPFPYMFIALLLAVWLFCIAGRQRLIAILPDTLGIVGTLKSKRGLGTGARYHPSIAERLKEWASYVSMLIFAVVFVSVWLYLGAPKPAPQSTSAPGQREPERPPTIQAQLQPINLTTAHSLNQLRQYGKGNIEAVIWAPQGLLIPTLAGIWQYSPDTWNEGRLVSGGFAECQGRLLAVSLDGTFAAATCSDNVARLFNLLNGEKKALAAIMPSVAAFSPDGKHLAVGGHSLLQVYAVQSGTLEADLHGHQGEVTAIAFSPDSLMLVSGGGDKSVRLWDIRQAKEVALLGTHTATVSGVAFSPAGKWTASSSNYDHDIRLWDVATRTLMRSLTGHSGGVSAIAFNPDGSHLVSGSQDHTSRLWDVITGREVAVLATFADMVRTVGISPDGRFIAAGSDDGTVRVFSGAGTGLVTLAGFGSIYQKIAFDPSRRVLALGSTTGYVTLKDLNSGDNVSTLTGASGAVAVLKFSKDGKLLAFGSVDGSVTVWNVRSGQVVTALRPNGHQVLDIQYQDSGQILSVNRNENVAELWSAQTGQKLTAFKGHMDFIADACLSVDMAMLATASADRTIKLWKQTGELLQSFDVSLFIKETYTLVDRIALTKDKRLVAAGTTAGDILLLDTVKATIRKLATGHSGLGTLELDPTETLLVTGKGTSLAIWNLSSGENLFAFSDPRQVVWDVAFSADNQLMASIGTDGLVRLWGVP